MSSAMPSGPDCFGAWHYSGAMGRFVSADGLALSQKHLEAPQRWNGYAYVRNNPLRFVDPDGFDDADPESAKKIIQIKFSLRAGFRIGGKTPAGIGIGAGGATKRSYQFALFKPSKNRVTDSTELSIGVSAGPSSAKATVVGRQKTVQESGHVIPAPKELDTSGTWEVGLSKSQSNQELAGAAATQFGGRQRTSSAEIGLIGAEAYLGLGGGVDILIDTAALKNALSSIRDGIVNAVISNTKTDNVSCAITGGCLP